MLPQAIVEDSAVQLGNLVAQARVRAGLSQEEFAAKAGVSSHTLLDFEAGRGSGISYRNLIQLLSAAGLGMSVDQASTPVDYVTRYLAPWNSSERNRLPMRVGDNPARARARLARKRRAIYGRS